MWKGANGSWILSHLEIAMPKGATISNISPTCALLSSKFF